MTQHLFFFAREAGSYSYSSVALALAAAAPTKMTVAEWATVRWARKGCLSLVVVVAEDDSRANRDIDRSVFLENV